MSEPAVFATNAPRDTTEIPPGYRRDARRDRLQRRGAHEHAVLEHLNRRVPHEAESHIHVVLVVKQRNMSKFGLASMSKEQKRE